MNDIVTQQNTALAPQQSTERAMIQRIADMAADPACDPDKMEKLLNVQITLMDRQAKIDFDHALADVQRGMPRVTARGEIKTKDGTVTSRYMKYEDIDVVIRPLLQQHGFSLVHDAKEENGKMLVTTILKHRGGHQESVSSPLPFDQTNALKSALQAAASTESFGKRRNVCKMLNIVAEGEDDDGAGTNAMKIDDAQAEEIKKSLRESSADVKRFLAYMKTDCVENIAMRDYGKACVALRRKVVAEAKQATGV
jgi:hypothetical protein